MKSNKLAASSFAVLWCGIMIIPVCTILRIRHNYIGIVSQWDIIGVSH